ncbi:helix-turn-helix transcriptional regulator [Psychrobacillus sp. FSL K6-2684]|uniref:helix-turn-helix transcriptional regulator n=2 Tax=Psychrobacillus sp. FSL K6-2684 TaxID=2921547 RepID=UPI0030F8C31E
MMRTWLRKKREEAGLTQDQLAKKAGIARATYGHIESGERNATVASAKKISNALSFSWTLFFEDECHDMKNEK